MPMYGDDECSLVCFFVFFFFFQAEDGIRDWSVTGVQTCALPICCLLSGTILVPVPSPSSVASSTSEGDLAIDCILEIGRASCRERV